MISAVKVSGTPGGINPPLIFTSAMHSTHCPTPWSTSNS